MGRRQTYFCVTEKRYLWLAAVDRTNCLSIIHIYILKGSAVRSVEAWNAVSWPWVICLMWYFHCVVFATRTIMSYGHFVRTRFFLSPVCQRKFWRNQCCQLGSVSLHILQAWSFTINGYQLSFLKEWHSVRQMLSVRWSKSWNHIVQKLCGKLATAENYWKT